LFSLLLVGNFSFWLIIYVFYINFAFAAFELKI